MDQTHHPDRLSKTYRLLALCARAEGHPAFAQQLARQLAEFDAWPTLPIQADAHGLGPLVWHHLINSGLSIPSETRRGLLGLYLRQQSLNQAYAQTLLQIASQFEKAGVRFLLFKGLALACQFYPDPALRPFSDLDLLVERAEVRRALQLLIDLGFAASLPAAGRLPKVLLAEAPSVNGVSTHIELHHYDPSGQDPVGYPTDSEFQGFGLSPHTFQIKDQAIPTPPPTATLRYLSIHLTRHLYRATSQKPLQLKWVADMVSLAERQGEAIDWADLRRRHPAVLQQLALFYTFTPRPDSIEKAIVFPRTVSPNGPDHYPSGWPFRSIRVRQGAGFWSFLWQTFWGPSDWWLRLYYGVGTAFWVRWFIYPARILRLMLGAVVQNFIHPNKPN